MPTETVEIEQTVEEFLDSKSQDSFTVSIDKGDFGTLGKSYRFYSDVLEWSKKRGFTFEENQSRGFVYEDGTTHNDPFEHINIFVFKKL